MIRRFLVWLMAVAGVAAIVMVAGGQLAWRTLVRAVDREYHVQLSGSRPILLPTRLLVSDVVLRYPVEGGALEAAAPRVTLHLSPSSLLRRHLPDDVVADNPVFDVVVGNRARPVLEPRAIRNIPSDRATITLEPGQARVDAKSVVLRVRDVNGLVNVWCRQVDADVQLALGHGGLAATGHIRSGPVRSSVLDISGAAASFLFGNRVLRSHGELTLTTRSALRTEMEVHFGEGGAYEISASAESIDLLDVLNATIAGVRATPDYLDWPDKHEPDTAPVPVELQLHVQGSTPADARGDGRIVLPGGVLPDVRLVSRLNEAISVRSAAQQYERTEVVFSVENRALTVEPTVVRAGAVRACIGGSISHPTANTDSRMWILAGVDAAASRTLRISPELRTLLSDGSGRVVLPLSVVGGSNVQLSLPPDAIELALDGQAAAARQRLFFGSLDRCWPAGPGRSTAQDGNPHERN